MTNKNILLLTCFLLLNIGVNCANDQGVQGLDPAIVDNVVNYLNLNLNNNNLYLYKDGVVVGAQQKVDILEVILDVIKDCNYHQYAEVPCSQELHRCVSYVQVLPQDGSINVLRALCEPVPPLPETNDVPYVAPPTMEYQMIQQEIQPDLSHEVVSSASGEEFVAMKNNYPCLGCMTDINTDAQGISELTNTAINHIQSENKFKHVLLRILRAQRQVVAGIKYVLLLEIGETSCEKNSGDECALTVNASPKICEIHYFEQPWKGHLKHIVSNNCTMVQQFSDSENDLSNDVTNYINQNSQEITSERLNELERQVIPEDATEARQNEEPSVSSSSFEQVFATEDKPTGYFTEADDEADSNFSTQSTRQKRNIGQLEKITQEDKALVRDLADFAANSLDSIDEDDRKRVVLQILGAKKMKTSELYYHLILRIGVSRCHEDSLISENCRGKLFEDLTKICKVQILVDENKSNPKIMKSRCQNIKRYPYEQNHTYKNRQKRQVLGGPETIDTKNSDILDYALKTTTYLDTKSPHDNKFKVTDITEATSQVVAGSLYKLKAKVALSDCTKNDAKDLKLCNKQKGADEFECSIEIWSRLWLKSEIYTVNCDKMDQYKFETNQEGGFSEVHTKTKRKVGGVEQVEQNHIYKNRPKRQIPGAPKTIDTKNSDILDYALKTTTYLDTKSPHDNKFKVTDITEATSQVVAGALYKLKAKVALSDCTKNDAKDLKLCKKQEGADEFECSIEIWSRLWLKSEIYTVNCERMDQYKFETNQEGGFSEVHTKTKRKVDGVEQIEQNHIYKNRPKRQIKGAPKTIDTKNSDILDYALKTTTYLDTKSPHDNKFKVTDITEATSQVVAGALYKLKAKVALSDCTKNDAKDLKLCNKQEGADEFECSIEIWSRLWLKSEIYTVNCDKMDQYKFETNQEGGFSEVHTKTKRKVGGVEQVELNDTKVHEFLKYGLTQLDSVSEHPNKLKLKEVLSVSKQVVAGQLWKIKAKLVLTDCLKEESIKGDKNDTCEEMKGEKEQICLFEVWDQPWVPKGRKTNVTCEHDGKTHAFRSRRDVHIDVNQETFKRSKREVYSGKNDHMLFKSFIKKHQIVYESKKESKYRFKVFQSNLKKIYSLNKHEQGTAKYGITKFADLTPKEFSGRLGYNPSLRKPGLTFAKAEIPNISLPDSFDWRDKKAVTEVKNQGNCGSCWAFSTTGNIEGQYAIKHGNLLEFSEQELVDCDTLDNGCNGGLMDNAYRMIEKMGGLELESAYPYDAKDDKCHFNKALSKVRVTGALNISTDETDMAKWLVQNGPISIAINANAMQFYYGGVSHPWSFLCSHKSLDHGVLIVGYGVHTYPKFNKSLPYWIVKNSWGPSWGEQGYYRVYRGDGTCGVNQTPSSAIVE